MARRWLNIEEARVRATEVTPIEFVTWHPSWILLAGEIRTGELKSVPQGTMHLVGDRTVIDIEKQHPTRERYCLLRKEGETHFSGWLDVGRTIENDVVINDYTISRNHARIRRHPKGVGWILEDRGSTNYTFVAGEQLKEGQKTQVKSGTFIRFGRLNFTLLEPSDFCTFLLDGVGDGS